MEIAQEESGLVSGFKEYQKASDNPNSAMLFGRFRFSSSSQFK